jgi:glutathione synthase/RimK-type ligase-like ATP-grasp enzyme
MKKHFLIIGDPADLHADYVGWALEQAGYKVGYVTASPGKPPTRCTLYLDGEVDEFGSDDWTNAEAVWCRRVPKLPPSSRNLGEDDGFILAEQCRFTRWLIGLHEHYPIRWINRPSASFRAENKFLQLKGARAHGLVVPRTLVTTKPERFKAFLASEGSVVAKPLCGYAWEYASGETLAAFANVIDAETAATLSDADIARCPTMYQQRVDKIADIRMLVLGQDLLAYKIVQEGEQHLDYRIGFFQQDHLRYEPISVPASVKTSVNAFVNSLGIEFASADFALTPDGEFVFLDLNPNGQWLFLESGCPADRVGARFCSFFVKGSLDSTVERRFPSLADFMKSDHAKEMKTAFQEHVEAQARPASNWKEQRA